MIVALISTLSGSGVAKPDRGPGDSTDVRVSLPGARIPRPVSQRYIATVAVDRYHRARPLHGAVLDAGAVSAAFREHLGFEAVADGRSLDLHDTAATGRGIESFTRRDGPLGQLPSDSMVVLYVALHGHSSPCGAEGNATEVCGEVVPQDGRAGDGFDIERLLRRLDRLPVRHVLLLLDTCDSGMALGGLPLHRTSYAALRTPSAERRSRKVITAAALDEDADDGDPNRRGRFAATLIDGLAGDADLFPDGNLLFAELAVFLQVAVTDRSIAEGRAQRPEFGGFLSDGRGSPSLGSIDLPPERPGERPDDLLREAKDHLNQGRARRAQGILARYLMASGRHNRAARKAIEEARALARKEPRAAVRRIQVFETMHVVGPARAAVLQQFQAGLSAGGASAERDARQARSAALDLGGDESGKGRAALLNGLGAIATVLDVDGVAGDLAAVAWGGHRPGADPVLAENASGAYEAAGRSAQAAALRKPPGGQRDVGSYRLMATPFRPTMLPLEPGEFAMGSPKSEVGRLPDEALHRVRVSHALWVAETEVTQAQWSAVMGDNPSYFKGADGDTERPVEQVSQIMAVRYCNRLSQLEGLRPAYAKPEGFFDQGYEWDPTSSGYRLPTEAEWEYFARAGTSTATYVSDPLAGGLEGPRSLAVAAWYRGHSASPHPRAWGMYDRRVRALSPGYRGSTHPVKGKRPNDWGLHDVLGNVMEWTADEYVGDRRSLATAELQVDPIAGGPGGLRVGRAGRLGVLRGGSFADTAVRVRAAARVPWRGWAKAETVSDNPQYNLQMRIGFRPVRNRRVSLSGP